MLMWMARKPLRLLLQNPFGEGDYIKIENCIPRIKLQPLDHQSEDGWS